MKTAIVSRVRKLIALAGSPNEHEARSSAWLAVKAIRDNDLQVVDPASASFGIDGASGSRERDASGYDRSPPPPRPPRKRVTDTSIARAAQSGWCTECRERFERGDWCATSSTTPGQVHAECASSWTVEI